MSDFKPYPMKLAPVLSPRPWGGERLRTVLKKDIPAGEKIGESWELSDHPDGRSRIANGPYAGQFFGDLVRSYPREMCGIDRAPDRFPLLVKYIDADEDLSLQVHPGDDEAKKYGDRGKAECWYIIDCAPGAEIIHGLREDVTPDRLRAAIASSDPIEKKNAYIRSLTRSVPIRPGTFVNVPPGTVHAILGGTLLCEIQQSSNLTFRLWDWGRQPERPLHVEEGLGVAIFGPGNAPAITHEDELEEWSGPTIANHHFLSWTIAAEAGESATSPRLFNLFFTQGRGLGVILNVIKGRANWCMKNISDLGSMQCGDTWFLPAALSIADGNFLIHENMKFLVSVPWELHTGRTP
ncbi:class I mannose-6-phosphate isomerase [Candidatus Sumerlaeota bacterium]|nr:class I mannose-6-phosphate isomerase [Candidatus Sumerlaeota bacterium]